MQRTLVKVRESERCCRCGTPTPVGHWHHRRSRRVRDQHTHCSCNGVWLCATCHRWVHDNPLMARIAGFIVSVHTLNPWEVPVQSAWGERWHDCIGNFDEPVVEV